MTEANSNTLRSSLAAAVKRHMDSSDMTMRQIALRHHIQYSRLCQICRGDVGSISSDAIVDVLGAFGYRITGIVGSGEGTEIVLSLDKAEKVFPEIEKPSNPVEIARPMIEEYAAANGLEVDHESIDAAAAYCDDVSDPDADRVVSTDE